MSAFQRVLSCSPITVAVSIPLVSDMIDGRGVLSDVANNTVSDTLERREFFVSRLFNSYSKAWDREIAAPWLGISYWYTSEDELHVVSTSG